MKRVMTITVFAAVVLGCFTGAGFKEPSALAQGHPGANCKSDSDCGFNLVCRPQGDGTGKCVPSNQPAYDPSAIGALPWCHSDAECPPGYFCEKGGHQEGDDTSRGHCSLPTGVTE